jgi:hypothetical protein
MRRAILLAFLLLVVLACPRRARADDAAVAEAKARFNEGVQLADQGKHEEARLKFQQAAAVLKAAAVLYNLARAEQLTGHDFEAIEHFRQFLRISTSDPTIKDEQRQSARGYVTELTPRVGQVDVDAPAGSRISIDGKVLDESPKEPVAVPPGKHTIEAAFEGKLKSVSVECTAGKVVKAKIEFESGGTTEPPGGGGGGGGVFGGWSTAKTITVAALGAGAAAGIGVGIAFALSSQSAKSESEDLRSRYPGLCANAADQNCQTYDSKRNDADSASTIAKVGYIAGGILAVGAIAAIVAWPRSVEQSTRRPSVTPLVGPNIYGAAILTNF